MDVSDQASTILKCAADVRLHCTLNGRLWLDVLDALGLSSFSEAFALAARAFGEVHGEVGGSDWIIGDGDGVDAERWAAVALEAAARIEGQ